MKKIPFQNGVKTKNATVVINDITYTVKDAEYEGDTPLSAENLNQLQENVDDAKYDKTGGLIDGECIVSSIKSKNEFNINDVYNITTFNENYKIIDNKLILTSTGTWSQINFLNVPVIPNKKYTFSCKFTNTVAITTALYIYNSDDTALGSATNSTVSGIYSITFTPTSDTIKLRISSNNTGTSQSNTVEISEIQLELGDKKSSYCKYIDFKNNINIETNKEIATNEFRDKKRVYLKSINFGALPNNTSKRVSHGLTNVNFVRHLINCTNASGNSFMLPYVGLDTNVCTVSTITNTEIVIKSITDHSSYNAVVDLYYTK